MTGRERLAASLAHRTPDRVAVDFGASFVTGIHVSAVTRLRRHLLGDTKYHVKVCEPYQILGEIDDDLLAALPIDVLGVLPRKSIFGTEGRDWKPFTLADGTECLVPGDFNVTRAPGGGWHIYPEGDTSVLPSGYMPDGGCFFDAIIRQEPIDDDRLNPTDNLEEFKLLDEADLEFYRGRKAWFEARRDLGALLVIPGAALGDIALVPAPFLKHPKGIRDIEEWYVSTVTRQDYVLEVFERQCTIAEQNLHTLPFGTPDEVYRECRERIDIFGPDGGFVFDAIHNIQGPTSLENMLANFRAITDSARA